MTVMVTKCGSYWEPDTEQVIKWQQLYGKVDVYQELNAMAGWLDANQSKRKTLKGMARFCNSWLSRAQEKNGSPQAVARQAEIEAKGLKATRDMSMEEMMGRDWAK